MASASERCRAPAHFRRPSSASAARAWDYARLAAGTALVTGCAPAASFRAASALLGEQSAEVGAGAAFVGPRPYVDEPGRYAGQVWGTYRLKPWLRLSAIGAFDLDALALGGAAGWLPLRSRRFVMGVEGELGYAWTAVSIPLAVSVTDAVWVYGAPRLGTWGDVPTPFLPLGVSVGPFHGFVVRAECQVSWADFAYYNRRVHLGLGSAYQF